MSKIQPLVSILLPNLNTRPFLEERMATIFNQTYTNWELIIADSYSDDGAWEYLSQFPAKDARITAYQIPKGLYQAWNFCIEKAQGKYIYIATSDDTMVPDCLTKMVAALEEHPECDICDSLLKVIDEDGQEIDPQMPGYPHRCHVLPASLKKNKHIRYAPYDGLLQLYGNPVYMSVTQILIRRSLFNKTGLFSTQYGGCSDYQWDLLAGFIANTIFIPEALSCWRRHNSQATSLALIDWQRASYDLQIVEDSLPKIKLLYPAICQYSDDELLKPVRLVLMTQMLLSAPLVMRILSVWHYFKKYPYDIFFYPLGIMLRKLKLTDDIDTGRRYAYELVHKIKPDCMALCIVVK